MNSYFAWVVCDNEWMQPIHFVSKDSVTGEPVDYFQFQNRDTAVEAIEIFNVEDAHIREYVEA